MAASAMHVFAHYAFLSLQGIVKQFFNEKEVTSTLVMDALFCGCKVLADLGKAFFEVRGTAQHCTALRASCWIQGHARSVQTCS